jgi:hypothetical protein
MIHRRQFRPIPRYHHLHLDSGPIPILHNTISQLTCGMLIIILSTHVRPWTYLRGGLIDRTIVCKFLHSDVLKVVFTDLKILRIDCSHCKFNETAKQHALISAPNNGKYALHAL